MGPAYHVLSPALTASSSPGTLTLVPGGAAPQVPTVRCRFGRGRGGLGGGTGAGGAGRESHAQNCGEQFGGLALQLELLGVKIFLDLRKGKERKV